MVTIHTGDCREVLKTLADCSVNCCVTSPPYYGLRDYGHDGQIGLEATPEAYVAELLAVFEEVRRVLRADGTLWLNLGDSYAADRGGTYMPAETLAGGVSGIGDAETMRGRGDKEQGNPRRNCRAYGLKHKDLIGIPWRVAFALQAAGWWLRSEIIWHKPNPMPESVTDRPTKSHEQIFLLAKSERYFYDADAIMERLAESTLNDSRLTREGYECDRPERGFPGQASKGAGLLVRKGRGGVNAFRGQGHFRDGENGPANRDGREMRDIGADGTRNKRSVWTVSTKPYREAHFATFPTDLITPCILAGCPVGGVVLDPFGGSGTTGEVAEAHGRHSVLIELNPAYVKLSEKRTAQGGLLHVA